MANLIYPNVGALKIAATIRTFVALSVIHLIKAPISLLPGTTLAALTAIEADFDGYTAIVVTAFLAPYIDPAGGASIQSGTEQFQYGPAASPPVINNVYGFYLLDAAGDLLVAGTFDAPVAMQSIGDALPMNVILNYGG
jgi:hypothetical protein